jgi:deoxyadenosine/deoxycytidine kinase
MASFIELSGTAGSGKTTLYKELVKLHNINCSWIPAHHIFPKEKCEVNTFKGRLRIYKNLVAGKKRGIDTVQLIEAGERFIEQNSELQKLFWENIYIKQKNSLNGVDQRFDKANFLYTLIQKMQIILENPTDKFVLVDEGPSKIIDVLSNTTVPLIQEIDEILKILPLLPIPKAVIYLETGIKETVKRILNRKHVIRAHKNLTVEQIENFVKESHDRKKILNKFYSYKGVPTLYLDSSEDVKIITNKVIDFLKTKRLTTII